MANPIDIAIVAGYLVVMLVIGFLASRKEDLEGYFVNNRKTKTLMLLTATIATTVGAGVVIVTSSLSYRYGIGMGIAFGIAILAAWLLVALLAKKIKTFGDRNKALTLGDFYEARYTRRARLIVAFVLAVVAFLWMAIQFVAMGNMFSLLTGLDFRIALITAAAVTIIYVSLGGIKSDFYTDAIQFWILLLIFIMLVPLGLSHIGGISALATLPPSHFSLFTFGGPILFFGVLFLGIPFSLVSMDTWQRVYSAADAKTAKKSLILAAMLNPLFYAAATLIGLIAAVAFVGINGDIALFKLMETTLPTGLLGIGMVSLLAVVMSTVDSQIVLLSAIATKDFYKTLIKPSATSGEMLRIGRFVGFGAGLVTLTIAYLLPNVIQLAIYGTGIILITTPAIIGGFFWKRATAKAAILSILSGFFTVIVLVTMFKEEGAVPAIALSAAVFVVASYVTKHSPAENVELMKA